MKFYLILSIIAVMTFSSCAIRVVAPAPQKKVVVIKTPPPNHKVVVFKGKKYYRWNGKYHRKTANGYVAINL